jgi:hypothetical protein
VAALVDIYNLALGRIGTTATVAAPDEASIEARSCRRYYDTARNACLEAHDWPFARGIDAPVALTTTFAGWPYAWAKPGRALVVRGLSLDYDLRTPIDFHEISYRGPNDEDRTALLTEIEPLWVHYTAAVTDPARFSNQFVDALAWRLAADVAMSVAKGREMRSDAMQAYRMMIQEAQGAATKAGRRTIPESQFIRARA